MRRQLLGRPATSWTCSVPQCATKSKRSRKRCRRLVRQGAAGCGRVREFLICMVARPRAASHRPIYKHGRHSRHLHPGLLERYAESLTDTQLVALKDEIAMLDVRTGELVGRLETGESEILWEEARRLIKAVQANRGGPEAAAHLKDLFEIIERGAGLESSWSELREIFQDRRKLTESER